MRELYWDIENFKRWKILSEQEVSAAEWLVDWNTCWLLLLLLWKISHFIFSFSHPPISNQKGEGQKIFCHQQLLSPGKQSRTVVLAVSCWYFGFIKDISSLAQGRKLILEQILPLTPPGYNLQVRGGFSAPWEQYLGKGCRCELWWGITVDSLHEPAQRWEMSLPHISVMGTGEPLSPWDLYGWKKKKFGLKSCSVRFDKGQAWTGVLLCLRGLCQSTGGTNQEHQDPPGTWRDEDIPGHSTDEEIIWVGSEIWRPELKLG